MPSPKNLSSRHRAAYDESERTLIPTLLKLKFGNTEALAKLTTQSQALAEVADRAAQSWRQIHSVHFSSMADATATETARLLRSYEHANRQLGMVEQMARDALREGENRHHALGERLLKASDPPNNAGIAQIDAEARALIRAQVDPSRAELIARAHRRAVATATPQVAGISPELHKTILREHLGELAPQELAEFDDLGEAVEAARAAVQELQKQAGKLIDFDAAKAIKDSAYEPPRQIGDAA